MPSTDAVLVVDDVFVRRGGQRILDGVSLAVESNSRVLIRGESGAGKTTLFQVMGLLSTPDDGSVIINGINASDLSERRRARVRRDSVGLVFQDFQLIPDLTAWENAALPQQHRGRTVDRDWLTNLFDALRLDGKSDQYPATLSGGEKQRVAIARALVNRPSVVIADEPTGQLDPTTSQRVLNLMHSLYSQTGTSLVVISHDTEIGSEFETKLYLRNGSLDGG